MNVYTTLMLCAFLSCSSSSKLKIEPIVSTMARVNRTNKQTGEIVQSTQIVGKTARLDPKIIVVRQDAQHIGLQLQGHIGSGGHMMNRVKKIRLEQEAISGNSIRLKYRVEIKQLAGKESAHVRGYNYSKLENFKIPKGVTILQIELHEDFNNHLSSRRTKLIAEESINLARTN